MRTKEPNLLAQLQALAEPRRLVLLRHLAAGLSRSGDLSAAAGLSRRMTRYHLSVLADVGLVSRTFDASDGRSVIYSLNAGALAQLGRTFDDLVAPPVISFVAKSGTGKTTFLEALIPALKSRGVGVGVLKHHSHPTPFDMPGKDTYRHAQAGADVVVGACPVQVAVFRQEDGTADLDSVVARHFAGLDLVIAEGFKQKDYPKIEVHRVERSSELLCSPDELLALVTDTPIAYDVPQFDLDDVAGVADFLVAWLYKDAEERAHAS